MDIKEYIASGIIEEYVLGAVSSQEKQEVECMSHIYPEVKEALKSYEKVIENFAMANAVSPPKDLKNKIFKNLETKVVSIQKEITTIEKPKPNIYTLISIAASILLLIAGYSYYQIENKNALLLEASNKSILLKEENSILSQINNQFENRISFYKDTLTNKVELLGTDNHPNLTLNLFWNKASNQVIAYGNSLPILNKEKEYQLWAIVNSVPVSLGKLDSAEETVTFIELLDDAKKVEAFAVTIEPLGGSESPTMEEMQVIGYA